MTNEAMTFQEAIEIYRAIYRRFERIEGRPWGIEGATLELVKQVGDLSRRVMSAEGYYYRDRATQAAYAADRDLIGDELADIFGAIIRIADHYGIDLEQAHIKARQAEDESLKKAQYMKV